MKLKKEPLAGFTTPLHLATSTDDLRPTLGRVHFYNGDAIATDAHVLVIIPLKRFNFSEQDINNLNGHSIHRKMFSMIVNKWAIVSEGKITFPEIELEIVLRKNDEHDDRLMSQCHALIPAKFNDLSRIGVKPRLLEIAARALGVRYGVTLKFVAENRGILLTSADSECEGKAVVMPTMIHN